MPGSYARHEAAAVDRAQAVARQVRPLLVAELAERGIDLADGALRGRQRRKRRRVRARVSEQPPRRFLRYEWPMWFKTSRLIGVFGCAARIIPICPPIDVPTQSTLLPRSRASSAVMSAQ